VELSASAAGMSWPSVLAAFLSMTWRRPLRSNSTRAAAGPSRRSTSDHPLLVVGGLHAHRAVRDSDGRMTPIYPRSDGDP
jgi:hypothetical protein